MGWIDIVFKPEAILYTFGSEPPLTNVLVKELTLIGCKGVLEIDFWLSSFPVSPPKKWLDRQNDTVLVRFALLEVNHLCIQNWDPRNDVFGDISLDKDPNGIRFEFLSFHSRIICVSSFVHLASVNAITTY